MKLYSYDHCPYCVKARMIFGFKNVPFDLVTLLNDDEENPIRMIGQKMCPILEKDDGSFMPESLDIIAYVDGLDSKPIVGPALDNKDLGHWLIHVREYHYRLAMPRWPQMPLEEFATPGAQAYFTRKKEKAIGPFSEALTKTDEYIKMAHEHLQVLENILGDGPFVGGEQLSIDDFHLFASLRVLTTTQGIRFPEKVNHYVNFISEQSNVPLHWEMAI